MARGVDGWALAGWSVRLHARRAHNTQIERLQARLPGVLAAVRADRAIVNC
jgi:hypothetical protein